jgi:hypothetical protein
MSDLNQQSGPKRTCIRSLSPIALIHGPDGAVGRNKIGAPGSQKIWEIMGVAPEAKPKNQGWGGAERPQVRRPGLRPAENTPGVAVSAWPWRSAVLEAELLF